MSAGFVIPPRKRLTQSSLAGFEDGRPMSPPPSQSHSRSQSPTGCCGRHSSPFPCTRPRATSGGSGTFTIGGDPVALADRMTRPDTRTKFEKWLDSLSDQNRAVVLGWLNDPTVPNVAIADWIREDDTDDDFVGYRGDSETIAKWRRSNVSR